MAQPQPQMTESPEQREQRLAWERERLEEAYADIAAGRVTSGQAAVDWLEAEIAEAEAAPVARP
jgi:hypothetical protein